MKLWTIFFFLSRNCCFWKLEFGVFRYPDVTESPNSGLKKKKLKVHTNAPPFIQADATCTAASKEHNMLETVFAEGGKL